MSETYRSIAQKSQAEFKDRGSKFLAYAFPVNSLEDIKKCLLEVKTEHPKAVHHCYAWRLGIDGTQYRANDDGEPSGSAGKPILGQLDSAGITNTLVIVVRYFGGTLLGVPGLINAYKLVTAEAIQQVEIIEKDLLAYYELQYEYPIMNQVLYTLKQADAVIIDNELLLYCTTKMGIALKNKAALIGKLEQIHGLEIKPLAST